MLIHMVRQSDQVTLLIQIYVVSVMAMLESSFAAVVHAGFYLRDAFYMPM